MTIRNTFVRMLGDARVAARGKHAGRGPRRPPRGGAEGRQDVVDREARRLRPAEDAGWAIRGTVEQVLGDSQSAVLGKYHTAALKADGMLWTARREVYGQLGTPAGPSGAPRAVAR